MAWNFVIIWFHDNARPYVASIKVQKLTDLEYETLSHSVNSPDLSPTKDDFSTIWTYFLRPKTTRAKGEVKTAFKDFFKLKPLV